MRAAAAPTTPTPRTPPPLSCRTTAWVPMSEPLPRDEAAHLPHLDDDEMQALLLLLLLLVLSLNSVTDATLLPWTTAPPPCRCCAGLTRPRRMACLMMASALIFTLPAI